MMVSGRMTCNMGMDTRLGWIRVVMRGITSWDGNMAMEVIYEKTGVSTKGSGLTTSCMDMDCIPGLMVEGTRESGRME